MTTAIEPQAEAGVRDGRFDEVWDGELVMSPAPNWLHQRLGLDISLGLHAVVRGAGRGEVLPAVNVSDRADDWEQNFRIPDVAVYLAGNPAVFHVAHVEGGPDLAVEILSDREDPRAKLGFYAAIGTRELLVVDRAGDWSLELLRLDAGTLVSAGTAAPGVGVLVSQAVGITFALEAAGARPAIVVTHPATGREWRA